MKVVLRLYTVISQYNEHQYNKIHSKFFIPCQSPFMEKCFTVTYIGMVKFQYELLRTHPHPRRVVWF